MAVAVAGGLASGGELSVFPHVFIDSTTFRSDLSAKPMA